MAYTAREPRTASAVTRQFFEILDNAGMRQSQLGPKILVSPNSLGNWRGGHTSPSVVDLEAALAVLGFEMVIQPITEPERQAA